MSSRLDQIENWVGRAETARYNGKNLAAQCRISSSQLERYFRSTINQSPQEALNGLRLKHALPLVQEGLTIKEIADRLGYKQGSHFSRQFKKFYGVAPSCCAQGTLPHEMRL